MNLIKKIDLSQNNASKNLEEKKQKLNEQYFTPIDIAKYMASLFSFESEISILDAGAGVGNLGSVAAVNFFKKNNIKKVVLTLVEWDQYLESYLLDNMLEIKKKYQKFDYEIECLNFYNYAFNALKNKKTFNRIILNPPYSKISRVKADTEILEELNALTPNTYTSFIELSLKLLSDNGELVAIVPRSFCNGTYYTKFRKSLLQKSRIDFIHLFESRKKVFKEYGINQEVVIIKLRQFNP